MFHNKGTQVLLLQRLKSRIYISGFTKQNAVTTYSKQPFRFFLLSIICIASAAAHSEIILSGESRFRLEHLEGQYRASSQGSDQTLFARTLVKLENSKSAPWGFTAEFIDARDLGNLADDGSSLSTSTHNPLDILQLNGRFNAKNFSCSECELDLQLGRFTMDVGSRRLVARNRFRNTINAFTGLRGDFTSANHNRWQFWLTQPVQRRVDDDVLDNSPKLDKEISSSDFWGVGFISSRKTQLPFTSQFYVIGINEDEGRNRDFVTVDGILKSNRSDDWFWSLEAAYQFGDSRASSSSDTTLDHRAYFLHADLGHKFSQSNGKLSLLFDIASGDSDSGDNDNNRFDPLFSARGFDYGHTSLYGAFARSNIASLGLRWQQKFNPNTDIRITIRNFQLADKNDAWTTAGIRLQGDQQTTDLGNQLETRVRGKWKNLHWEVGAAYLLAGQFQDRAGLDDTRYIYSSITYKFKQSQ